MMIGGLEADNRTVSERAEDFAIYRAATFFSVYYVPVIAPIGIVGNTLAFLVMTMKHNRGNSCCNLMAALSVSDNCMMYVAVHFWVLTPGVTRAMLHMECKVLSYSFSLFTILGVYLIVFMTIDRFVAVRFPLHSVAWCTARRARATIAALGVCTTVYALQFLATIDRTNDKRLCSGTGMKTPFSRGFSIANALVSSIIPFVSIVILNSVIISTLRRRARQQRSLVTSSSSRQSSKDAQLVVMLMLVSFAFLFLTFPICVRYILASVLDHEQNPYHNALYTFLYHLTQKLSITNNAVNFYLYCIGGAKFRADLRRLCCRKKSSTIQRSNNDDEISTITQSTRM